jgi:MFS transporter, ACS family, hexuronate transporter
MPAALSAEERLPPVWRQVRWRILALLFVITVFNFIDRQTLSILAPKIREAFHLSNSEYGTIVSAFMFGMMVGEFPMGWLMDRRGARPGFTFAVLWWSLATGLHSMARAGWQFAALRFWMGTGECGNYSGGVKVVSEWFPARERALAVGIFNGGSMIGSVIAPPLIVFLTLRFGWRMAFVIPAAVGAFWVLLWRATYRPLEKHPGLGEAERAHIRQDAGEEEGPAPPTLTLLRRRETWAVMLCRMLAGPVVQFYWFWTAEYLYRTRGLSLAQIGMFAWVPFVFGDIGSIGGGWLAGALMRRGVSLHRARLACMAGGGLACTASLAVAGARDGYTAIAFICVVLMGHTALSANMFATISDLFPRNAAARVTGLTGIAGGLSGLVFPLLTGFLVDRFSYTPVFAMAALMPLAGVATLFGLAGRIRRLELAPAPPVDEARRIVL